MYYGILRLVKNIYLISYALFYRGTDVYATGVWFYVLRLRYWRSKIQTRLPTSPYIIW